jgi:hypothetical protein
VRLVLPARRAELLKFEALSRGPLILHIRVVPVFALVALKRNDFARHVSPLTQVPRSQCRRPRYGRLRG